jgi:diguanylate cyclase (GGDEF)-like protein/PAS domain S-box-containing protein
MNLAIGHHPEQVAALALQALRSAVIITDSEHTITYVNREAERLIGWGADEAQGHPLDDVLHLVSRRSRKRVACRVEDARREVPPQDHLHGVHLVRRDRRAIPVSDSAESLRDDEGNVMGMVVVLEDVSERLRVDRQLQYEATHDSLTGLVNRRGLERRLRKALRASESDSGPMALIVFDLDRFKLVNDNFGHAAGDQLLRKIARILRNKARRHDVVARIGGDEFAALLENCPPRKAGLIAERLRTAIGGLHFMANTHPFSLGASVGLLHLPRPGATVNEVLAAVDAASYRAKARGGNCVEVSR